MRNLPAIEGDAGDAEAGDMAHPIVLHGPMPARSSRRSRMWMSDRVEIDGIVLTFGNWTHTSGERRNSCRCKNTVNHGNGCYKYRIISKFDSVRDALVWMYCWGKHGQALPDKPSHRFVLSSASMLADAASLVDDMFR